MKLIGVDVGGTFTDVVYTDTESGATHIHKAPTSADDPARAVLSGVEALCSDHEIDSGSVDHILHGTTIATNTAAPPIIRRDIGVPMVLSFFDPESLRPEG